MSRNYLHLGALVTALALSTCTQTSPKPPLAKPVPQATRPHITAVLEPAPSIPLSPKPHVIVFAGHTKTYRGEKNGGGSISVSGIEEYVFNDRTVDAFSRLKEPSAHYTLIRADQDVPLQKRPQFAADEGAQVYIEIHHDSVQPEDLERLKKEGEHSPDWKEVSGFSVFYGSKEKPKESLRLAKLVGTEMLQAGFHPNLSHAKPINAKPISGEGRKLIDPTLGVYDGEFLFVLRSNSLPAVLVEEGVIANPNEEKRLLDPAMDDRFARAIDRAVSAYLKK